MYVKEEIADWEDFKWNYAFSDTKRVCEIVDENGLGDEAWEWLEEISNADEDGEKMMSLTELNDTVRYDESFKSMFVNPSEDDNEDFEY